MLPRKPPVSPYLSAALDFGYTLLTAELLLGYAGYRADRHWRTSPWLTLLGILLGLAVSFKTLFTALNRAEKAEKAARRDSGKKDGPR